MVFFNPLGRELQMNFISRAIEGVTWTTAASGAGALCSLAAIFNTAIVLNERARWRRCSYGAYALNISEVRSRGVLPLEKAREEVAGIISEVRKLYPTQPTQPSQEKGILREGDRAQEIAVLERWLKEAQTVGDLRYIIERLESFLSGYQPAGYEAFKARLSNPQKKCAKEPGSPISVFTRDIGNGGDSWALTSYTSRFKRKGVISFYREEFALSGAALAAFGLAAALKLQYNIPLWNGAVIAS